ncbi:MAG: hypothetical protein COC08_05950 [Maribacter sp.]|nr:MAG: hypothetical protein COC08_05950 [Maribacter sp.]
MKKLLALVCLMFILVSATDTNKSDSPTMHSLQGTWELQSFYNYDEQKILDTISTSDGYRQIKMYYNGKIMWTRYVPENSVEWFGYGSYKITENKLIETLEYGSASMMSAADTLRVFTFELLLDGDYYSQITLDENGNRTSSENYKRLD